MRGNGPRPGQTLLTLPEGDGVGDCVGEARGLVSWVLAWTQREKGAEIWNTVTHESFTFLLLTTRGLLMNEYINMNDGICELQSGFTFSYKQHDPLVEMTSMCVPVECCLVCRALLACWASALCCSTCMGSTGPEEGSGKAVVHWGRWAAWPSPQAQEAVLLRERTERQHVDKHTIYDI